MEFFTDFVDTAFGTAVDVLPIAVILVVFQVAVLRRR
ncbi:MAG: DUF1538 domain-containing protein, partial [Gammaproteobacteria bacterium]|nr:DUF1538 domain-containing protein [Gammaproteobacteria bacterium]